jgi:hypothetical protein
MPLARERGMSEKVRVPFTFIVRTIEFGPRADAPHEGSARLTLGPNDEHLDVEDMALTMTPEAEAAIERKRRDHEAKQKQEAKDVRRRARAAEEARWEPMPIPAGASRPLAAPYGNMRRLKPPASLADASTYASADNTQTIAPTTRGTEVLQSSLRTQEGQSDFPNASIVTIQDDEELVGPAIAEARQLHAELQSEIAEEDLLALNEITDELPQTPRSAVTKIERIIASHALEKDFTGSRRNGLEFRPAQVSEPASRINMFKR